MSLFVVDEGAGEAVLLIHGLAGVNSDWSRVASALMPDHRLLVPDRPGYGRSGGRPMSMMDTADILADTLCRHDAAPAIVVGHSYGGGVAVLLAAHHPSLVSGLVLVAPVGRMGGGRSWLRQALAWPVMGEVTNAVKLFATRRLYPRLRHVAGSLAGQPPQASSRLSHEAFVDERSTWMPGIWRTTAAEQRSLLREIGSIETSLSRLRLPTVVVVGALDDVVPPSVAVRIAAEVQRAELVIVPNIGHVVPRDAPDVLVSAIRSVERRADGRGPWDPGDPDVR